jgi:hypothetical protein
MKRAGFQLATRFKDTGAQAGTLAPGPGEGERVTAQPTIEWIAPDGRGRPVIVHVSANAADGSESADGDFVYTAASESASASAQRK